MKIALVSTLAVFFVVVLLPAAKAETKYPRPETYIPTWDTLEKHKRFFDDPRPYLKEFGLKQILPKEFYDKITFDQEKMKAAWSELVGFKAPDAVGKLHPEIKPGKYTYKDLAQNQGFKKLMVPELYSRIQAPGGNWVGTFSEFEIVPTRQYYWSLPITEMTKKFGNKCKLDSKGYIANKCWEGGFPFSRPAGEFKTQQVMYNMEKFSVYFNFNQNAFFTTRLIGFSSNRKIDYDGKFWVKHMMLSGRALMEPIGYYDSRAKQLNEIDQALIVYSQPRDQAGQAVQQTRYNDSEKPDQNLVYIPAFRRVRKMAGTDTQDAIGGQDVIYDDNGGWAQKLTPNRYPYKMELLDEREYLVIADTTDGNQTIDGKTYEYKNIQLERRPLYVVKLTQLDKNYIYSARILYIDKETFMLHQISNFDQKGRLYRTYVAACGWFPEVGMFAWWGNYNVAMDHVDKHTTIEVPYNIPAVYNRDDLKIAGGQGQK